MAVSRIPKIQWDTAPNTLEFGWPLDAAVSYLEPVEGSTLVVAPSGVRDSWIVREEPRLAATARWIPTTDGTGFGVPITGWDGATGWRAFLSFARTGQTFEFFPDRDLVTSITSHLVSPFTGEPPQERSGERSIRIVIASADSTTYDGY